MRAWLIRRLKAALWSAMRFETPAKFIRLVAEEYEVFRADQSSRRAERALADACPDAEVLRGPFAGLSYGALQSVGSVFWPKILGSYELELQDAVERAVARGADLVVDIGAAEGYYAVGLARRIPHARVVAFEGNAAGRDALRQLARLNGVADRVAIEGWCTSEDLRAVLEGSSASAILIVCDAEGAEVAILDPTVTPRLLTCDMLIELHSSRGSDPRAWVESTFGTTHDIRFIDVAGRDPARFPEIDRVASEDRRRLLFERTDGSGWAALTSRGGDGDDDSRTRRPGPADGGSAGSGRGAHAGDGSPAAVDAPPDRL